jgi:hypothetical protein
MMARKQRHSISRCLTGTRQALHFRQTTGLLPPYLGSKMGRLVGRPGKGWGTKMAVCGVMDDEGKIELVRARVSREWDKRVSRSVEVCPRGRPLLSSRLSRFVVVVAGWLGEQSIEGHVCTHQRQYY